MVGFRSQKLKALAEGVPPLIGHLNPWSGADEDNPVDWKAWWRDWLPGHILSYLNGRMVQRAIAKGGTLGDWYVIPPGYDHVIIHKRIGDLADPLNQCETVGVKLRPKKSLTKVVLP